jgi:hypothetical protein
LRRALVASRAGEARVARAANIVSYEVLRGDDSCDKQKSQGLSAVMGRGVLDCAGENDSPPNERCGDGGLMWWTGSRRWQC